MCGLCKAELVAESWDILLFISSPNRRSDPGGTSFAKGFKFAGEIYKLCLMRSCLNWFISVVDVPNKANESVTGVRIYLKVDSWVGWPDGF